MRLKATLIGISLLGLIGASSPAAAQWTGCGAGAHGGFVSGNLDVGGPIGSGSTGQVAGLSANCDYRMGAFVAGAFVDYDWVFGDLKTLGVSTDLTVGGRLGVLINQGSLLYAHAGWTQLHVTGISNINGWKAGIGNEFRIPNSPMYLDLRWSYADYDVKDLLGPIPDATAHTFRLGVNVKFGPGAFGGKGEIFTNEAEPKVKGSTDPKLGR